MFVVSLPFLLQTEIRQQLRPGKTTVGDYLDGTELGVAEGLGRVGTTLLGDFTWCSNSEGGRAKLIRVAGTLRSSRLSNPSEEGEFTSAKRESHCACAVLL